MKAVFTMSPKSFENIQPSEQILVVDIKTTGRLAQPFEQNYNEVVVLDTKGVEIRKYEQLSEGKKYAIHRERIDADFLVELDDATEQKFLSSFLRMWSKDKTDLRKPARLALKSIRPLLF